MGKKLTKNETYNISFESDTYPSEETILAKVLEEVPMEMIDKYELNLTNYATLKVGDIVKIITTKTTKYAQTGNIEYSKVIGIENNKISVENYNNKFDLLGNEITRKKKDIARIELPNEGEIREYENFIKHQNLINEFEELVFDYYFHKNLHLDDLEYVVNLLKKSENDNNY